jgi:hypothetical protein
MDTETIKNAIDYKKGHIHLTKWALNKDCSISVFVGGEPEITKSKDFEKIKECLECADETEIVIFNNEGLRKGWALIIPYNDDEEIVADYTVSKFMEEWDIEFIKLHEELQKVA